MAGGSEYKLNNRVVTYTRYNAALEAHNILVKAKNFLVFQVRVHGATHRHPAREAGPLTVAYDL